MIRFHGTPITPHSVAIAVLTGRHAMVSFSRPDQCALAFEVCQSVAFDCGAYSIWQANKGEVDIPAYLDWCLRWFRHPAFAWAIAPDSITGTAADNDVLLSSWLAMAPRGLDVVPVYHLHEPLERLAKLVSAFPRVAFGSSGEFAKTETHQWWDRIHEVMDVACDELGQPLVKLHGLRMLSNTITSHIPLASADSTNIARNCGLDKKWTGSFERVSPSLRAQILAERIESHATAVRWSRTRSTQTNLELIG